ncbi:MAG: hypothetical protein JNL52_08520 [Flavobacteriales bacterium]|nr:hypothetical protein [Flavobacteriales bacterium]
MNRCIGALLVVVVSVMLSMPTAVLVRFQLRRAYVERELCVQREVMADMRTCHGECHLSKQLKALEHESEQGFPAERFQERFEPVASEVPDILAIETNLVERSFPDFDEDLLSGNSGEVETVPRG